jgi:hypothetical protein
LLAFEDWRSNFVFLCIVFNANKMLVDRKCEKGASNNNYSRQLLKAIGRVDALVTSDEEVYTLMMGRLVK